MKKSTVTNNQEKKSMKNKSVLQEKLVASELRYRRLFESTKDGILILDAETGKIVDVNQFLIDLLGYSKKEFIEKFIWEIGAFQDIIENKDKFIELQQTEYVRYENLPLETSDGNKILVEFVSNVYLENNDKVIQCQIRDITERKETEAALEKIRKELAEIKKSADELNKFTENVIDTIREPLLAIDEDLRVINASRSFYKFFRVTAEETIGKLIYELGNHQWDIPKLRELLEKIIPEKKSFDNYEVEHHFSSIGKRVMLLNARQVKRTFGKEQIILLAIEDITERKGKEDTLKETHRATSDFLNILLNHMHAPIIIWDASFVIKRFNRKFEELSGYDSAEVIDKKIDFLFPKDKIAATLELLKNHLADEQEVVEIDILTKENNIRTVLWSSSRILDEEGKNIIATISQDITSRKRLEDTLSLLETRYRRLFESANDGILILDAETGKIVDVNPFFIDLLGYSKKEFIEKSIWEIGAFKDIYKNKEKFFELQQEKYIRYDDLPIVTSDGRKIHVEFVSSVYLANNTKAIQCNIRDITERKIAQKEIKFQADLINNVGQAVIATDLLGKVIYWNNAAEKIYGWSTSEAIGESIMDLTPAQQSNEQAIEIMNKLSAGKTWAGEFHVKRKDGTSFPAFVTDTPILDSNGKLTGIIGISSDITERKQAEDILKDRNIFLQTLINAIPAPVFYKDSEGRYIGFNKAFELFFGKTSQELSGKTVFDINPRELAEIYQAKDLELFQNPGKQIYDSQLQDKQGIIHEVVYHKATILDSNGHVSGLVGVILDITERKQMEIDLIAAKEKAEESEEKFRLLFNEVEDAIFRYDQETYKIIEANKATSKIYGYKQEELIGMSALKFSAEVEKSKSASKTALQKGKSIVNFRHHKKKDGTDLFLQLHLHKIVLNNQPIIYAVCHDITENVKYEQDLKAAKEKAEESDRLKTSFLNNISHEIRTPMNAITGFSRFINNPDLIPEKRKNYTDIIIQSSDQLLAIIDDIISIASIEAGQEEIQENETNINLIGNLIKEQFSSKAYEKNVTLILKSTLPDDKATIITDTTKLTQIISNLVDNALKFTQQGSIEFGYSIKKDTEPAEVEFFVEDSGIGIPPDMHEIIFNRFRQVETTATRNFGGSGLGLCITKAYVELLGGKIWLTSELGKGSVFYFTIPYKNTNPKKINDIPPVKELDVEILTNKTLLIAEDENSNFFLLEEMFLDSGINIIRAVNGIEAVELCKSNPHIDLVLMDLKMPEMDGCEATRQIRKFKPDLPIIAQTAYSTNADRSKALACGCSDFIVKPLNKELLLSKINDFINRN